MQTPWFHNYSAVGNSLGLTAFVVSIPILFLFWALSVKRMKGHVAGLLTLLLTIVITIVAYRMPVTVACSAAALGMTTGLIQIGWIILAAVFLYNLVVESGKLGDREEFDLFAFDRPAPAGTADRIFVFGIS